MSATNKIVRMKKPAGKQCVAVNEVVALLHDRWNILVLGSLAHARSLRYGEVQRAVAGISQRMLTMTLKTLEENGLVKRTAFATVPPRVDYELTRLGRSLVAPLKGLLDWSLANREALEQARRAYAEKSSRVELQLGNAPPP